MYKVRFKVQTISSKQLCIIFQMKTHVVPRLLKAAGRELVTGDNRNKHRNVATTCFVSLCCAFSRIFAV